MVSRGGFGPRIDPASTLVGAGGIALHDGAIPVRRAGLGTRRLITLSLQRHLARKGGLVLIDEVEHGLEPYRLRRLLAELLSPTTPPPESSYARSGVVVLTTHSPIALGQLRAEQLRIVRSASGTVRILAPSPAAQGHLITHAEAFLSRRVIVCEGRTEMGLVLGLDDVWGRVQEPFASVGVALADAGGIDKVAALALDFARLEYPTAIVADSDKPLQTPAEELETSGIRVLVWADGMATEQRLFADLPWTAVVELIECALAHDISVREQLTSRLGGSPSTLQEPKDWTSVHEETRLREALGAASKKDGWFKNVRLGMQLGRVVAAHVGDLAATDLGEKVTALRDWVFE